MGRLQVVWVCCLALLALRPTKASADPIEDDAVQKYIEYRADKERVGELEKKEQKLEKLDAVIKKGETARKELEGLEKSAAAARNAAAGPWSHTVDETKLLLDETNAKRATADTKELKSLALALEALRENKKTAERIWKDLLARSGSKTSSANPVTSDALRKAIDELKAKNEDLAAALEEAREALEKAKKDEQSSKEKYEDAKAQMQKSSRPTRTLSERLSSARQFRCKMAYCWGGRDGTRMAIEPVLDLPVGLVWAVGKGALPSFVNSHTFSAEFNLGLRWWFAYDKVSLMVYISKPIVDTDDTLRLEGSSFSHSKDAIHRSYPSVGLGLFGDVLLIGFSYDVLRNGDSPTSQDPNYPPGEVLSRAATFTLAISPFNLSKNALGAAK